MVKKNQDGETGTDRMEVIAKRISKAQAMLTTIKTTAAYMSEDERATVAEKIRKMSDGIEKLAAIVEAGNDTSIWGN